MTQRRSLLALALGVACGDGGMGSASTGGGTASSGAEAGTSASASTGGGPDSAADTGDGSRGVDTGATGATETGDGSSSSGAGQTDVLWPLSVSAEPDADAIGEPYGPRWIGRYDFHAGVDLPADEGTPVGSIMDGTVVGVFPWDGDSTAGNKVVIEHADDRFSGYLHLSAITVDEGDVLLAGELVGAVGDTGASSHHLHLTTMIGLRSNNTDERKSVNPLEWLPHSPPAEPPATFVGDGRVELTLEMQRMTLRTLSLSGGGETRTVDYYDVVALGSVERDEQTQFGVHFEVENPIAGLFLLTVQPDPDDFVPDSVVLEAYDGGVILDAAP